MRSAEALWKLLHQAYGLPYGTAKIATVEQVIAHSEGAGDRELAFAARMLATEAYQFGGENTKSYVTFSWCVSDFDRDPAPFHAQYVHRLLWAFKWVAGGLRDFPEIPLARTYAVLDDMERRYREGGHSLQAVHKIRFLTARHLGDAATAETYHARWQSTPRDELSDCAGCDPSSRIEYLVSLGRDDEAMEVAGPVLQGRVDCARQPQRILTSLMVPYLRTGQVARAADAHRRAYRINRTRPAETEDVSEHIEFCARSGNEHRGLEILQRHVGWLDDAPSPGDRMRYAARCALLLRRLTELGHGQLTVSRPWHGETSVSALAGELAATAREIAGRFDARNGSDAQSRGIADILTAEPYGVSVPLSPTDRRAPRTPVPARPEPPPVQVPGSATAGELLDLADQHEHAERPAAAALVLAALDERFGDLTPEQAGRRAEHRGFQLWAGRDRAGTLAALAEAVDLYREAGATGRLSATRARLSMMRAGGDDEQDDDLDAVRADVAYQLGHGDPRAVALARSRLAAMFAIAEDFEEALAELDRIGTGDPVLVARFALQRARYLLPLNRFDEAAAAAGVARAFYRHHGEAERAALAHLTYGQAAMDVDDAIAAFDEALAIGHPAYALEAYLGRARELVRGDRPAEAVDDYVEVVALHTEVAGDDGGGPYLRDELARAYEMAGRPAEAAEVAEQAVTGLDAAGDTLTADNTRYLLAGLYRRLGDTDGALALYDEVIGRLGDNPAGRAQLLLDSGDLLYRMDRDVLAAERFAAAAMDYRTSDDLLGELRALRMRISALFHADDNEAAVETARLAVQRHTELPAEFAGQPQAVYERALTGMNAAQVLVDEQRWFEAREFLEDAPERLREIGATHEMAEAAERLALVYDQLGRADDAARIRAEFDLNGR